MPKPKLRRVLTPHEKVDNYVDKHRYSNQTCFHSVSALRETLINGPASGSMSRQRVFGRALGPRRPVLHPVTAVLGGALENRTPDEVYQSGFGGGATIPDHFGGKKAALQDENTGQRCATAKTAEALA